MKPVRELLFAATRGRRSPCARAVISYPIVAMSLVLIVVLVGGCRSGNGEDSRTALASVELLIREPTQTKLDPDDLTVNHQVAAIQFVEPGDVARWRTPSKEAIVVENGVLRVTPEGGLVSLIGRVGWKVSAEIDRVLIHLESRSNLRKRAPRLFWAGPGEQFSAARSSVGSIRKKGQTEISFNVRGGTPWPQRVERIRLDLATKPGVPVAIERIEAVTSMPRPDLASFLETDNWQVELDHDVRNAVLTTAAKEIVWVIRRPGSLRLRFSYGKLSVRPDGLRVRVSQTLGDGPRATLFEEILEGSEDGGPDEWHEAEVVLEPTRKPRTIIFESAPVDTDSSVGVAAWANPELVPFAEADGQSSIVLVSLDTLRADRLSLYGYPESTSPNLTRWAENGAVVFLNTVAAAPRTLPSHASLFSGIDAFRHGANFYGPIPLRLDLLPEILRSEGYKTLAITGGGVMHPDFGLTQGFDEYSYWPDWAGGLGELEHGLHQAREKLGRNSDRPIFLFLHTYEIHDPYVARPPYSDRCYETSEAAGQEDLLFGARPSTRTVDDGFQLHYEFIKWRQGTSIGDAVPASESDLPLINCLYDSGIAYTDNRIGPFLSDLQEGPGAEQRIVVLTSDHGESLGEQGRAKHAYLSETNLMVPLVLRAPGLATQLRRIEEQVSLVDVAPTILELVSSTRATAMDGDSLLPLIEGQRPRESERRAWSYAANENRGLGVRFDNQFKYTFNNTAWEPALGHEELFDVRSDPFEQTNLRQSRSDLADHLRGEVVDYMGSATLGVQVWFRHRGCGTLEGEIGGRAVRETTIKAVEIPLGGLTWSRPNELTIHVAPGESFGIVVEEARGSLEFAFRISGCPDTSEQPFRQKLRIDDMPAPWSLTRRAGDWRVLAEADDSDDTLVTLIPNLHGPVFLTGADAAEDPLVLEQLRALGYIN